jgi:hypothetical protein
MSGSYATSWEFEMQIFIHRDGKQFGPYPLEQAQGLIADGQLALDDPAWIEGLDDWVPLQQLVLAANIDSIRSSADQESTVNANLQQARDKVARLAAKSTDNDRSRSENRDSKSNKKRRTGKSSARGDSENESTGLVALMKRQKVVLSILGILVSTYFIYTGASQWIGGNKKVTEEKLDRKMEEDAIEKLKGIPNCTFDVDINGHVNLVVIQGVPISEKGWEMISNLRNIHTLALVNCKIENGGLVNLSKLPKLENLNISSNKITDVGLGSLEPIKTLKRLNIEGTEITAAGEIWIKKVLPSIEVIH